MIPMTPQELIKTIVSGVGALIDARIQTCEINLKTYIHDQDKKLESNLKTYVDNKVKILETNIRTDIREFRNEITGKINDHEDRITVLEEVTTPLSSKH